MIKDKATYIMAGIIVLLLAVVSIQANIDARKDGEIQLLKEKLAFTQTSSEEHKQTAEDAKNISQKNQDYTRCLFDSFVTYTQTQAPIEDADLDKCIVVEQNTPNGEPEPTPVDNQPSNPAPAASRAETNNQQGNQEEPQSPTPEEPEEPDDPLVGCQTLPLLGEVCL